VGVTYDPSPSPNPNQVGVTYDAQQLLTDDRGEELLPLL
jgi:hypothetical protein